ncbi:hypothetical protein AAG570_004277 [Ranatra chinensis]|uniref:Uncharacterized protein n=1 Tax=Ranatra chinensis TaxID=642074 RepID=A0ABD0Y0D6_9HEMI
MPRVEPTAGRKAGPEMRMRSAPAASSRGVGQSESGLPSERLLDRERKRERERERERCSSVTLKQFKKKGAPRKKTPFTRSVELGHSLSTGRDPLNCSQSGSISGSGSGSGISSLSFCKINQR